MTPCVQAKGLQLLSELKSYDTLWPNSHSLTLMLTTNCAHDQDLPHLALIRIDSYSESATSEVKYENMKWNDSQFVRVSGTIYISLNQ